MKWLWACGFAALSGCAELAILIPHLTNAAIGLHQHYSKPTPTPPETK